MKRAYTYINKHLCSVSPNIARVRTMFALPGFDANDLRRSCSGLQPRLIRLSAETSSKVRKHRVETLATEASVAKALMKRAFRCSRNKRVSGGIFARRRTKDARLGFTLVETVVACAILLLVFAALIMTFIQAKQNSFIAQRSLNAIHIGRNEVETLRSMSYSEINPYGPVALSNTVLSDLGGTKQCTVITNNGYKEIILTITWMNPSRTAQSSNTFNTLICNTN